MRVLRILQRCTLILICLSPSLAGQALRTSELPADLWRPLGPANMGGRVTEIAVHPQKPSTFYVAAATGGIWKTTSAGARFKPVFDVAGAPASVGAIAVSPADPDVVWAGTGEANARNSASYGFGVWRSEDGGETWAHKGLRETRHIGRIAVHPTDPKIAFVAAVGHLWGANRMRGLYRTIDGGATWAMVLALDENTGCIDVAVDQRDPKFVYAAAYEVRRDGFDTNNPAVRFGKRSGIYRSEDGGNTWEKARAGLPTVRYGRIGLHLWGSDPAVVYAVVETELSGEPAPGSVADRSYLGVQGRNATEGAGVFIEQILPGHAAERAKLQTGDVITKIGGRSVDDFSDLGPAIRDHEPGEAALIALRRDGTELEIEVTFGKAPGRGYPGSQGGQAYNRQDRQGEMGFETGGVFVSEDHGRNWKRLNSLVPRPFYYSQIRVDPQNRDNLWVLGIAVNVSRDGGKSFKSNTAVNVHPDHHAMWINPADPRHMLLGNDGGVALTWDQGATWEVMPNLPLAQFYSIALDQRDPYRVYGGLQDNGTWVTPSDSEHAAGILPQEVFKVGGGDGFQVEVDPSDPNTIYIESQNGNVMRVDLAERRTTRLRQSRRGPLNGVRFNWQTPIVLCPSNPHTLWIAGHRVFRSVNRGRTLRAMSESITRTERGSATALAVAPTDERVVWVGTDDGAIHRTVDGGASWTPVALPLPGVGGARWVSGIEISRADPKRVYVVLDGHRDDDFRALVFKTEDGGESFQSIARGLPDWHARVLREDPRNPDLLWLGTETGVWISRDQGLRWTPANRNLPIVPVHDIRIHERDREVVLGTHGRGLWVADARAIQDFDQDIAESELHFFRPATARQTRRRSEFSRYGARRFAAERKPTGAKFVVWASAEDEVRVVIEDLHGKEVHAFRRDLKVGLNEFRWAPRRRSRVRKAIPFEAGHYTVTVRREGFEMSHPLQVLPPRAKAESSSASGTEASR